MTGSTPLNQLPGNNTPQQPAPPPQQRQMPAQTVVNDDDDPDVREVIEEINAEVNRQQNPPPMPPPTRIMPQQSNTYSNIHQMPNMIQPQHQQPIYQQQQQPVNQPVYQPPTSIESFVSLHQTVSKFTTELKYAVIVAILVIMLNQPWIHREIFARVQRSFQVPFISLIVQIVFAILIFFGLKHSFF